MLGSRLCTPVAKLSIASMSMNWDLQGKFAEVMGKILGIVCSAAACLKSALAAAVTHSLPC